MFRRIIIVTCAALLFAAAVLPDALAADAPALYLDGERIDDSGISFIENGTTFVPIRVVSEALGASVVEWKDGAAHVSSTGLEITAEPNKDYFTANGRYFYVAGGIKTKNSRIMVPVRLLCRAFGASAEWNGKERAVYITTGGTAIESGETFYDESDFYWLSRIIHAEASGEILEGKIAVGNVVLNRVSSPLFPNTVHDVIFDKRYGIQFSPAYSGGLKLTPSEESEAAAKLALEQTDIVGDSLYFSASSIAASSWAGRNRPYVSQIGNHCFFA